tara:strand:+ start:252 stop:482 length:231 start_codon:yes stop_codon:yes gene_type:complete
LEDENGSFFEPQSNIAFFTTKVTKVTEVDTKDAKRYKTIPTTVRDHSNHITIDPDFIKRRRCDILVAMGGACGTHG